MLDSRVWHQSNAITHGERWVIVIFYEVQTAKAGAKLLPPGAKASAAAADQAAPRGKVVRELLARRIKDAAKRKEVSAQALAKSSGEQAEASSANPAAWHGG